MLRAGGALLVERVLGGALQNLEDRKDDREAISKAKGLCAAQSAAIKSNKFGVQVEDIQPILLAQANSNLP